MKNDNTRYNVIDFITIASTGNAVDFGDLTATRGELELVLHLQLEDFLWWLYPTQLKSIDFITIELQQMQKTLAI